MQRLKTYIEAIREGTAQALSEDSSVILIGEGVPDPKAVFGSTAGLQEEFGKDRVFDMPVAENGLTGICIGAATRGIKPIMVHQRIDFSLYAMDQIVNNAAKWHSMFGGKAGNVPMVIRAIVGRGWGQGNQHSQNLAHLYAMIPGLKVVTPSNAYDAKTLLLAAVQDPNPVFYVEHRWLHNTQSDVPVYCPKEEIGKAKVVREGTALTVVAYSYMVVEALHAQETLAQIGINIEVIDLRTIRPLDIWTVKESVKKTGGLLCLEEAWRFNSLSSEIITQVIEDETVNLHHAKCSRITLPDCYAPSAPSLTKNFYPTSYDVALRVLEMLGIDDDKSEKMLGALEKYHSHRKHDVPDQNFKGPF